MRLTGSTEETIAAVSTAPGEGGIGIVRVSGSLAGALLSRIFAVPGKPPGETVFDASLDKSMKYGHIIDPSSGELLDEALVVFMKGPHSYTGEDVCEIQCHGGSVPLGKILGLLQRLGAVAAQPGEFTKRAFLNGRLDLAQAGAVIDLIRSKTALGYHAAREQASGQLSARVQAARAPLLSALAELAARIDYPEVFEDERFSDPSADSLSGYLGAAQSCIEALLSGAAAGRIVQDGLCVTIIGKPNAGKSSLFNALAREDLAIVTKQPGTTRDALQAWLEVCGVPVLLTDTAGIRRNATDEAEALGIARARQKYQEADVSIFLLDGSEPLSEEDAEIAQALDPEKKLLLLINKADLPQAFSREAAASLLPFPLPEDCVLHISLIGDEATIHAEKSARRVEAWLEEFASGAAAAGASLLVTKARHRALLEQARQEAAAALASLERGEAPELAEVNIRAAWETLGEITGETAADDVIELVFSEFCVGK